MGDKNLLKDSVSSLKELQDGESVNRNPLINIQKPDMRLYFIDENYFESIDELLSYCRINQLSIKGLSILDYSRDLANCSDVISSQMIRYRCYILQLMKMVMEFIIMKEAYIVVNLFGNIIMEI